MHTLRSRTRAMLVSGIALALPLGLAGPVAARPDASQQWLAGLSSQQQPTLFRFTADRRVLTRGLTTLRLSCTSGGRFYLPDSFVNVTVSSQRRFKEQFTTPPQTVDPTTSVSVADSIDGRVNRAGTKVSGTWQMTWTETDPTTNAVKDTCTTGAITFSARR
jgi:membrane peptidoglycan carboxypeptidase